jgi:hypothetical protein
MDFFFSYSYLNLVYDFVLLQVSFQKFPLRALSSFSCQGSFVMSVVFL